jgi:hypothetical protein
MLSSAFAGGLAVYLVYGPGAAARSAATIGFALNMAGEWNLLYKGTTQG